VKSLSEGHLLLQKVSALSGVSCLLPDFSRKRLAFLCSSLKLQGFFAQVHNHQEWSAAPVHAQQQVPDIRVHGHGWPKAQKGLWAQAQ